MRRHKFTDPVPGTFELITCAHGRWVGSHVDMDATGTISAPGIDPITVQFQDKVPHSKRPSAGHILPVVVDRADPQQFQIEWDQVPTQAELLEQELDTFREQASTAPLDQGFPQVINQGGQQHITVSGAGLGALPPQARERVEQLLGNLGAAFDSSAAGGGVVFETPQVVVNGQQVSGPAGAGSIFEQFQQMAVAMTGNTPPAQLQPATAVVLAAHEAQVPQFAASQAPGGIVDITLDVHGLDGADYSATTRVAFSTPQRRARVTQPGTEVPVLVDPANRNRVTIDPTRIADW
jgi:hypothetical protein